MCNKYSVWGKGIPQVNNSIGFAYSSCYIRCMMPSLLSLCVCYRDFSNNPLRVVESSAFEGAPIEKL